jgi:hypothetical protein
VLEDTLKIFKDDLEIMEDDEKFLENIEKDKVRLKSNRASSVQILYLFNYMSL